MPLRADAEAIFRAALNGVCPHKLVAARLCRQGDVLRLRLDGSVVPLALDRLVVAGAGKAAVAMAAAVVDECPQVSGLVIAPSGDSPREIGRIRVLRGGHPWPTAESFAASAELLRVLAQTRPDTEVLFLLSGGASALLASPSATVSIADKQEFTEVMLRCGAPISLLNRARMRLSSVKGGLLAAQLAPRRFFTLALSDVPTGRPWQIGSGPTVWPPLQSRRGDLRPELRGILGGRSLPAAVWAQMGGGPLVAAPALDSRFVRIGDNGSARRSAAQRARQLGYAASVSRLRLRGEAQQAAAQVTQELAKQPREIACVVFGGETTVAVGEGGGRGGRSQELALASVPALAGGAWTLLAAGTDGVDGPTPAAGAVVGAETMAWIGARELARGLERHDSYPVLGGVGALLETGPTGTNVGDLVIAIRSS